MGAWGTGLYSGDFAMDLRSTIRAVARPGFARGRESVDWNSKWIAPSGVATGDPAAQLMMSVKPRSLGGRLASGGRQHRDNGEYTDQGETPGGDCNHLNVNSAMRPRPADR